MATFVYKTDETLEAIGREFLARLGLDGQPNPDVMTIFAKVKHGNHKFNYRRVPDKEMPDSEGDWNSDKSELRMRESIFVGMNRGDTHSRFVVFHELSHYVLGHQGFRNRIVDSKVRQYSAAHVKHEEAEASRLAVILMAPEHLIPDAATAEEIAARFGMSLPAAIMRKDEVDRVRRRRKGELRPLPQWTKEFLRKARDSGIPIQTKLDDDDN
ncbi:ImmA/IrrE family metallo-endopeptidase [Bradyrhizobium sp. 6(2017)]|uniref:ImmA/IrrE family metallo-endopeptidase n=1 Tax=Bradyrhizobium sp. 6(2017) TaxID=1197460 RepID=UPI0013E1EC3A|nr:ImmA/IrrE family metallo-endopeptidase [Bradyrhizobium sp. 6(2017)]QIG91833.1 ImmA/IrrE family metallo-endopeptidase [Bradyrhizobium sp. 6(2017)]